MELHYAGFWRRAVAVVIDLILSAPFYYGLHAVFGKTSAVADGIFVVFFSIVYILMFAGRWQGSPGMRACKVLIVDTQGKRIGMLRSFWWTITSFVGVFIAFGAMIYLQTKFDLDKVNEVMLNGQSSGDIDAMTSQVEAITHVPFFEFYGMLLAATIATLVLSIIWMISVGASRQKAGFHNWICGTRMIVGRT